MNNKNKPRVIMVIGIVRIMRTGFTIALRKARTAATIKPVKGESMCTPGRISEVMITAKALTMS